MVMHMEIGIAECASYECALIHDCDFLSYEVVTSVICCRFLRTSEKDLNAQGYREVMSCDCSVRF